MTKDNLVTQRITLNGVPVSVMHSKHIKLPKILNTRIRATNNSIWKKLAATCLKN